MTLGPQSLAQSSSGSKDLINRASRDRTASVEVFFGEKEKEKAWSLKRVIRQGKPVRVFLSEDEGKSYKEISAQEAAQLVGDRLGLQKGAMERVVVHQHSASRIAEASEIEMLEMMEKMAGLEDAPEKLKQLVLLLLPLEIVERPQIGLPLN